ncbi:MAG TPA: hypothetical protein VGE01_09640 [Fimbriimonas sp.]
MEEETKVWVEGVLRRRTRRRFGPFRKTNWTSEPFRLEVQCDGGTARIEGLALQLVRTGKTLTLNARLGHVDCYLGDVDLENPALRSFNLFNVGGYELTGRFYLQDHS